MSITSWLAIDGGQSQIRLRHSGGAQAQADGVQHRPGGNVPGMLASIRQGLARLGSPRVQVAALGMSGLFQEDQSLRELARGVAAASGATRVLLVGDDVTGHAGALRGAPGVVAAIGTGTAVIGLTPGGEFNVVDGRGYLLGDEGSGFQLGRRGLRAVLEHAEGLHPPTTLTRAAIARYGPVDQIAHRIYRSKAPVAAVAAFAADVISAADAGEPTATGLVRTSMTSLARSITAAAAGFGTGPVPVVVVGGLMRSRQVLTPVLASALAQVLPDAHLQDPAGTALDGAAWLAGGDAGPYAPRVHAYGTTSRPTTTPPAVEPHDDLSSQPSPGGRRE
ncbi:N-acetylglucosamine kinase [Pseudactinotalea sp. Z1732]|uniref:N-acetylglucosamine kinase n=1 Tax=Pseudactinotalea sp. Z1732 TaxID=3413026 RepID=UPI003C7ECC88